VLTRYKAKASPSKITPKAWLGIIIEIFAFNIANFPEFRPSGITYGDPGVPADTTAIRRKIIACEALSTSVPPYFDERLRCRRDATLYGPLTLCACL